MLRRKRNTKNDIMSAWQLETCSDRIRSIRASGRDSVQKPQLIAKRSIENFIVLSP